MYCCYLYTKEKLKLFQNGLALACECVLLKHCFPAIIIYELKSRDMFQIDTVTTYPC